MSAAKKSAPTVAAAAGRGRHDSRAVVADRQRQRERREKLRAPLVSTSAERRARLLTLVADAPSANADTQAARLLSALQGGPITTREARDYLDIPCPAARVLTLRERGHAVVTLWAVQLTSCGRPHRFAQYALMRAT